MTEPDTPILSESQLDAFNAFQNKENIFLTGPGGSGKTFLIKQMVKYATQNKQIIQVCALTGCAAILLECKAKTIHSWSGIGTAKGDFTDIIQKIVSSRYKKAPWLAVDILIIDEVSMMSKKIFDLLNLLGKIIRQKPFEPFGGIQIILSGDFYQLPPIGNKDDPDSGAFCFESDEWNNSIHKTIQLNTIFRQTNQKYTKALNEIRIGKLSRKSHNLLLTCVNNELKDSLIIPTVLLPRRKDVDHINLSELAKLDINTLQQYHIKNVDQFKTLSNTEKKTRLLFTETQIQKEYTYLANCIMADNIVKLCLHTQVMCIANLNMDSDTPIVNGSQGIIVGFDKLNFPIVKFENGLETVIGYHSWISENIPGIGVSQIPLIYSWAITIHKAQGVTLEHAKIDAGRNIFECGQTYVALSRVKTKEGLNLLHYCPSKIKVNTKVQKFYEQLL